MNSFFPTLQAEILLTPPYVRFRLEDRETVFMIRDIRMIGEFTTNPGKLDTQYYFVFQIRGEENLIEVPSYCENLFPVLTELKSHISGLSAPKLQLSEGNDSNILYPHTLSGKKLYLFHRETRPLINMPILRNLGQVEQIKRTRISY